MKELKTITRQNLFEKIWATSMRQAAREFDMTDNSLNRVCKAHEIPIPPRGFTSRIKANPQTYIPSLPVLSGWQPNLIELVVKQPRCDWIQRRPRADVHKVPTVLFPPKGPLSHPYTERTRNLLKKSKPDDAGILISEEGLLAHIRVSRTTLPRALKILDALFIVLDQEPFGLNWPEGSDERLTLLAQGERFRFAIEEVVLTTRRKPSVSERLQQRQDWTKRLRNRTYQLTSRLRLVIQGTRGRPFRYAWTDWKLRPLEECLHEFLVALVSVGEEQRKERLAEGSWRSRWDRQAVLEKAIFTKQEQTLCRTALLSRAVVDWENANKLRGFLAAFRSALAQTDNVESKQRGQKLILWIEKRADALDPIQDISGLIGHLTSANELSTKATSFVGPGN